jgi:hypothetical protein
MKKYLILSLILANTAIYSQIKAIKNKDSIELKETDSLLSKEQFDKIINVNFSKLITGQAANNVGSYAGIDPDKTDITFSPIFVLKSGNILTGKMTGGITEGIYSLFNNSKLNTNIALEFQYHFLSNKNKKVLRYYKSDFDKQKETDEKANKDWKEANDKIDAEIDIKTRIVDNDKLTKENGTIDKAIQVLRDTLAITKNLSKIELLKAQIKIQEYKKELNNYKIADNEKLNEDFDSLKEKMKIGNSRADILKENDISKLKIVGYSFYWFSFAYKLRNDDFKLLNPAEVYDKQITKDNYISHEFKTQFSYVNLSSEYERTTYFTSLLTFKYKSNFNDLKKVEVTETNIVGTNSNQTREVVEKYFAYSGKYKTDIKQINIDVDFYHFPFSNNAVGFHLFPNSRFTDNIKPVYNVGFGIVFPFIDKKKEKSIVNAELYYNVVNIFNSKNSDYSLIERNNIGFRLSFPISFTP